MSFNISKRGFIRIVTFTLAIILALFIFSLYSSARYRNTKNTLEASYIRSIEDLSASVQNINTWLSKGIYSSDIESFENISSKLWREASIAKSCLSSLPLSSQKISNLNRFLSQVGNFSHSLVSAGDEKLSLEDYTSLISLYDYSSDISSDIWSLERGVRSGFVDVFSGGEKFLTSDAPRDITSGFTSMQEEIEAYPTLIYDGAFSDHILEKKPEISTLEKISEEKAKEIASNALSAQSDKLSLEFIEESKMPSYCFNDGKRVVSITENGGKISYILNTRSVTEKKIDVSSACDKAKKYLSDIGYSDVVKTYYETVNNIVTINFAYYKDDVVHYPDLIKVSVALDNGEILSVDARGYLANNKTRELSKEVMDKDELAKKLSPFLSVKNTQKALIPTDDLKEVLTYEFTCESASGDKVLVYLNAETGKEEDILILFSGDDTSLTM